MHPQIQRGEPGDCPICGMDLIPLEAGSNDDPAVLTMSEAAVAMARVQTTEVFSSSVDARQRFYDALAGISDPEGKRNLPPGDVDFALVTRIWQPEAPQSA